MLNVHIISRETIKPSSPTPDNLRYLQLSRMDQLNAAVHFPLILFYHASDETAGKSTRLKNSLAKVLTHFYPLAGTIKQDDDGGNIHVVECNDRGAEFFEARADQKIHDFVEKLSMEESIRLLPCVGSADVPLWVQFTVFECGGSTIGIFLSHKLSDGTSLTMLVNSWAEATLRGGDFDKSVTPIFGFSTLFPPKSVLEGDTRQFLDKPDPSTIKEEGVVAKRMVFEGPKIALLREKVHAHAGFFPTRVEALSGLIWRCNIRARGEAGHGKIPVAMHAVNIRGRLEPPLPENSFANLFSFAVATGEWAVNDPDTSRVGYLEGLLRVAIRKVKGDFVRETLEDDGGMLIHGPNWNMDCKKWEECGFDLCMFSSWCRFPVYESDFGWGKPVGLSLVSAAVRNFVFLVPTIDDEGIEAWIFILKEEMEKLEQDLELLAYASHFI